MPELHYENALGDRYESISAIMIDIEHTLKYYTGIMERSRKDKIKIVIPVFIIRDNHDSIRMSLRTHHKKHKGHEGTHEEETGSRDQAD